MFSILHACAFITMLVLLPDETFQTVCIPLFKYENRNEAVNIRVEDTLQRTFNSYRPHRANDLEIFSYTYIGIYNRIYL